MAQWHGCTSRILKQPSSHNVGKEEEEAEQATGLESPFPYVMTKFDAAYFELRVDAAGMGRTCRPPFTPISPLAG
jgi:hypothetical protein